MENTKTNLVTKLENAKPEEAYKYIVRGFGSLHSGEEFEELEQLRTLNGYGLRHYGNKSEVSDKDYEDYERFVADLSATHLKMQGALSAFASNFENIPEDELVPGHGFGPDTITPGVTDLYRIDITNVKYYLIDSNGNPMLSSYTGRFLARTVFGTYYILKTTWKKLDFLSR